MSLAAFVFLLLTPPPLEGDERTEILATIRSLTDGAAKGDHAAFSAMLEPGGATVLADMTGLEPVVSVRTNRQVLDANKEAKPVAGRESQFGVPTVLQRGPIAQVWVPFRTSVNGELLHCGIDNFGLAKRDGQWMVTTISYTVEPPANCSDPGMPGADEQEKPVE